MRLTVNLATRPYVELDRIFRQLRIAIALLAISAIALVFWVHARSAAVRAQNAELQAIQAKTAALTAERTRNEARLREPANAAVLQQVQFLNALFQRKSFSWTAVLMDLEEVLPAGVQVTSIDPEIAKSGEVSIHLRVSGQRERAVMLVRNLEKSHRFIAPRLVGEAQQQQEKSRDVAVPAAYLSGPAAAQAAQNGNLPPSGGGTTPVVSPVDFDIVAGYNPLQPRIRERVSRNKPSPADAADAALPDADSPERVPAGAAPTFRLPAAGSPAASRRQR